jgi:Zn-dependent M28 family amino/carboxypeptidase
VHGVVSVRIVRVVRNVRRILFALFPTVACLACGANSPPPAASSPAEPTFSPERFKAHVTFLADDLLEGREAGTRGHEIAARYVASQFEQLGVAPGGRDGSFFEPVRLLESGLSGSTPSLVVKTPQGTHALRHGDTVIIDGATAGGAAMVNAPLVFVGYGISDAAVGEDDYAGLDVRGKIVVALADAPKGMDSKIAAHLRSEQPRVAAEHGAVAGIRLATRRVAKAFPWERAVEEARHPSTTWVRSDGSPDDPLFGLPARATVKPTVAAALFQGSEKSLDQILDEAEKGDGPIKGFPLNATAAISLATKTRPFSSPAVVGLIEGSDPRLRGEYVILMAHADHIGLRSDGTGDHINNGALDNAAGVATLIEVARAFTAPAARPRRSILIVANTAEEKGLLGAESFAHQPTVPIDRITAAIDLDMPMLLYDFTDVVAYGASHSTLRDVFSKAAADMGVKLSPDPMPEQAIFVRSDHYPLAKQGVPAVMLATGMANGGSAAWATFLEKHYHQPSDDLSQPIVWQAGARFAELNYRAVRVLADADARAQWYAGDYFGNLFAPRAPKTDVTH